MMSKGTCVEPLSTGPCGKEAIEGSDRCIFHDPDVWKHEPKLVREKIREQIEHGDFNFEGYHFPRIDFSKIVRREFKKAVNFDRAYFHGTTFFSRCRFEAVAFISADFSGHIDFKNAKFSERAEFSGAKFHGGADFSNAHFLDAVVFFDAEFYGSADFDSAKFSDNAFFRHTRFSSTTSFTGAEFSGNADFMGTMFSDYVTFIATKFSCKVLFYETQFLGFVDFLNASFLDEVDFTMATFSENVVFSKVLMGDLTIDFSFSVFHRELFVDEIQWSRKSYRLKIEKTDLESAIRNYHILRKVFLSMGHYRVAGELFYNEMACRRKLLSLKSIRVSRPRGFWKDFGDWLWMQIFYCTCGFGERPLRVVGTSLATIFLFALAYSFLTSASIITAIYLSLDCFVTLAAFQPDTIPFAFRWLTYLEAGLGIALTSLFLVVFTRKMARD
jgi:uncharacterized protein YjbI with pentapeptide repeats